MTVKELKNILDMCPEHWDVVVDGFNDREYGMSYEDICCFWVEDITISRRPIHQTYNINEYVTANCKSALSIRRKQ